MMNEDDPHRDWGLYKGLVTSNVDATKSGKVRVLVPGHLEPDVEADVVMPGSPFNNGMYVVPAVGAEVCVGFLQGEYDSPVILGGFVPPVVEGGLRAALEPEDLAKVITLENEEWQMVFGKNETPVPYFNLVQRSSKTGEPAELFRMILNAANGLFQVDAPGAVAVNTRGTLSLDGRIAQIRNRPVQEGTDPI